MTVPLNTPISQLPLPGLLDVAAEALFAEFREQLIESGYGDIRPTHGCVFRFVHEDGMRLTDLAALAGMTKQSIGEIVDDLASRGYVERFPDPADRRAKLIRLTAKGEKAQAVGLGLFAKLEQRLGERHGRKRIAQLRELLEEITNAEALDPELSARELASA
jgi:DNA-binding MarR family transcriptional regulator